MRGIVMKQAEIYMEPGNSKEDILEKTNCVRETVRLLNGIGKNNISASRGILPGASGKNTDGGFLWNVKKTAESEIRTVTIMANDYPDIFSKIVGAFTLNGLDISGAKSFTQQGSTLDIFKVRAIPGHRFEEKKLEDAKSSLRAALTGELDLSSEISRQIPKRQMLVSQTGKPNRITVNNKTSLLFSILEVSTSDFPGLLFGITDALFRSDIHVWMAKISTKGDRVSDSFYIKDFDGQKIESPQQISALRTSIRKALPNILWDRDEV